MRSPLREKSIRTCFECGRPTIQVRILKNGVWRCRECGMELDSDGKGKKTQPKKKSPEP